MTGDKPKCIQIVDPTRKIKVKHQCTRDATNGDYCTQHANSPARKTRMRLEDIVDESIRALQEVVTDPEHKDRVKAALGVLDRTGYGPSHTVKIDDIKREIEAELVDDDGGPEPA